MQFFKRIAITEGGVTDSDEIFRDIDLKKRFAIFKGGRADGFYIFGNIDIGQKTAITEYFLT